MEKLLTKLDFASVDSTLDQFARRRCGDAANCLRAAMQRAEDYRISRSRELAALAADQRRQRPVHAEDLGDGRPRSLSRTVAAYDAACRLRLSETEAEIEGAAQESLSEPLANANALIDEYAL